MIISVTEMETHKRCSQKWDYTSLSRQGLETLIPIGVFELGSLIHRAHELWILDPSTDLVHNFVDAANNSIKSIRENYVRQVGVAPSDDELADFYTLGELGLAMCRNYMDYWKTPLPTGFRLIQPEQTIMVPVPGTRHCELLCLLYRNSGKYGIADYPFCPECGGEWHYDYLEGTLDGFLEDDAGGLWILERKTWSQHPTDDGLRSNEQFLKYLWIVNQLTLQAGPFYGRKVMGIAYDGMWKRAAPPARRTMDDLFIRTSLTRPYHEIQELDTVLPLEFADVRNGGIYRTVPWTGCKRDCHMKTLCDAEHRGEDASYIRNALYTQRRNTK